MKFQEIKVESEEPRKILINQIEEKMKDSGYFGENPKVIDFKQITIFQDSSRNILMFGEYTKEDFTSMVSKFEEYLPILFKKKSNFYEGALKEFEDNSEYRMKNIKKDLLRYFHDLVSGFFFDDYRTENDKKLLFNFMFKSLIWFALSCNVDVSEYFKI